MVETYLGTLTVLACAQCFTDLGAHMGDKHPHYLAEANHDSDGS